MMELKWHLRIRDLYFLCRRRFKIDAISTYSAQAAFYMVGSAIPLFALVLGITGSFFPVEELLTQWHTEKLLPTELLENVYRIAAETFEEENLFALISVGAIVTLWSAARGMRVLCRSVLKLSDRPMISYITAAFRGFYATVLLIAALGGVFLLQRVCRGVLLFLLSVPILTLMCLGLYRLFLPDRQQRDTFPVLRAVLCSLGWEGVSLLFFLYLRWGPRASYLYGSLGAILLGMIYIRGCLWIFLFFSTPLMSPIRVREERK